MNNAIHIKCEKQEDIAPLVLMPGDPLRAKYIAEKFLTDAKLVTSVRNMFGYTGLYKGVKVTAMGSGMGMPSMSIYAHELFAYFNVQKIIRIGTCGVCDESVQIPEVILADKVYSETNFDYTLDSKHRGVVYPSELLNNKIKEAAIDNDIKLHIGGIITSDVFGPYADMDAVLNRVPDDIHLLGEEMEAYALLILGEKFGRETACITTAVDSKYSDIILPVEDRERSLDTMIKLALDAIIK